MQLQTTTDLPRGARHAGQVINEAGQPTHHLILLPQRPDKRLNWQDAKAWASSVGGDLPSPQEQALLFANCRDSLPKTWCWSNKEDEEDASDAWLCHFDCGNQNNNHKSYECLAVAVRRLALEPFNPSGDSSAHVCTPVAPGNTCHKPRAATPTQGSNSGAAAHVLRQMQLDPRLAWLIGPGTRSYELLTEEVAAAHKLDAESFRQLHGASLRCEPWPRREGGAA